MTGYRGGDRRRRSIRRSRRSSGWTRSKKLSARLSSSGQAPEVAQRSRYAAKDHCGRPNRRPTLARPSALPAMYRTLRVGSRRSAKSAARTQYGERECKHDRPERAEYDHPIAMLWSPNDPISNVVIQTIASATMNAAAAAKYGLQRAAIHNNIGKIETRATSSHGARCMTTRRRFAKASVVRATAPSTVSLSDGKSRATATRPITNGAIVTMPIASDANQWYQIVRADAVDWWNNK